MVEHDWRVSLEKEEELCRALSNLSITLKELIKPPKLQVRVEI